MKSDMGPSVNRRGLLLRLSEWLRRRVAAAQATPVTIVVLGDSLSAEYGLSKGSGWVALLEQRLAQERTPSQSRQRQHQRGHHVGRIGTLAATAETTCPGYPGDRIGANDAWRLPLEMTRDNLRASCRSGAVCKTPPRPPDRHASTTNYGRINTQDLRPVFASVAKEQKAALVPFFLKDVAGAQCYRVIPKATVFIPALRRIRFC
jgi:acyl-CoA thioesterase-1